MPAQPPSPCPHCARLRASFTCSCRACPDLTWSCDCPEGASDLLSRDGLCDQCLDAGCQSRLDAFQRCTRLATP